MRAKIMKITYTDSRDGMVLIGFTDERGEHEIALSTIETADLIGALRTSLGACLNSRCSILSESDSTFGYEQVFSALEYRSDAASAAECAGLRAERPCVAVYR